MHVNSSNARQMHVNFIKCTSNQKLKYLNFEDVDNVPFPIMRPFPDAALILPAPSI